MVVVGGIVRETERVNPPPPPPRSFSPELPTPLLPPSPMVTVTPPDLATGPPDGTTVCGSEFLCRWIAAAGTCESEM